MQRAARGALCAGIACLPLVASAGLSPDTDGDGVFDVDDNCLDLANASQGDADTDGFGQVCACDLNDGGVCSTPDIAPMKAALAGNLPVGDINCDGVTNPADIPPFKALLTTPNRPGPSGQIFLTIVP